MASSTHHMTVLTASSSSTAASSTTPVQTWNLNPLLISSAVILACLVSLVVPTATVEDTLLSSNTYIGKRAAGNVRKANAIFAFDIIVNKSNKIRHPAIDLPVGSFISNSNKRVHNFALLTGASSPLMFRSRQQRKLRKGRKIVNTNVGVNGDQTVLKKMHAESIGLTTPLLDDNSFDDTSSKLVHFNSYPGINKLTNHGLVISNMSFKENKPSSHQVGSSKTVEESFGLSAAKRYDETLSNSRLNTIMFPDKHSAKKEEDDLNDSSRNVEFKPLPREQQPSLSTQTKRYPRSIDSNSEAEFVSLSEDELMSRTLHYVDKMQSVSEHCTSPRDSIIILKAKFRPDQFFPAFAEDVNKTVQVANTINDLLLYTKSPPEDFMDVFFAMTQSLVETGPQVTGCAIVFRLLNNAPLSTSSTPITSGPSPTSSSTTTRSQLSSYDIKFLFPYSYRTTDGAVVVTDLSMLYKPQATSWFTVHVNRSTEGLLKPKNRIYANKTDIGNLTLLNAKWNRTVTVTPEDGFWATPYYDCLLRNWIIQYSVPFYHLQGTIPEFKGVVLLEANFETIKINQCAEDGSLFSGTHRCKRTTTKCKNVPSTRLRVGSYQCTCLEGHHFPYPNSTKQYFEGRDVETSYMDYISNKSSNYTTSFNCLINPNHAPSYAEFGDEHFLKYSFLSRGIPLGIQSLCMTVSVVIGIIIVFMRKTKVMRSSMWILLELLLFGALLLYATVIIQYFEPTTTTCLLLPWFREVGFVIVYGVLVLKIYRILAEFQSRKAHRVHVRDKDLFKYLAMILTVVVAYMSAWTAVNIDHLNNNSTILQQFDTENYDLAYTLCRSMWWDYVIETGEFLFLCFGIYMCYCVRSASTEYSEGRFITGAICYEAIVSTAFYVLRHLWWYNIHPDHLFLMFFLRCQLTITVVLLIILGPKLWYARRPPDEDHSRSSAYLQSEVQDSASPETMKLNVGISSNGDVEVGEISLTEMDPEDIRVRTELKRLYTQLQVYKTKTMRKDNPHISKRKGGRKRDRRFSLQAFHKHRHHHDHEHDHETSKTPEESTNSAEAMTFTIEPSVKEDPNEGRSLPSVSFKSGHK